MAAPTAIIKKPLKIIGLTDAGKKSSPRFNLFLDAIGYLRKCAHFLPGEHAFLLSNVKTSDLSSNLNESII
jgi:hypothetical protein